MYNIAICLHNIQNIKQKYIFIEKKEFKKYKELLLYLISNFLFYVSRNFIFYLDIIFYYISYNFHFFK